MSTKKGSSPKLRARKEDVLNRRRAVTIHVTALLARTVSPASIQFPFFPLRWSIIGWMTRGATSRILCGMRLSIAPGVCSSL